MAWTVRRAAQIIAAAPVRCVVELGAGSAKKTTHLLSEQARQRGRPPKPGRGRFFHKTALGFKEDMYGFYSENSIGKSMEKLVKWGFVIQRKNPNRGWDQTYQYVLNYEAVVPGVYKAY